MDFDKIKQWMEITQQYQNGKFWEMVLDGEQAEGIIDEMEERPAKSKGSPNVKNFPKTDVYLTETDIILLMELPGAIREDIFLTVTGTRLSVRGVVQPPMINGVTVRSERKYGEFQRNIELPEPTDGKNILARFENGLLIVTYARRFIREENIMIR